jgi:DNA-binding transcriptional regulator YiaG
MARGPKAAYEIRLAEDDALQLRRLARAHTTPQVQALRARIVLAAHDHPAWTNQQLAHTLGTSDRLVRKWRRRWHETHSLADAPRSGAPRRFSP